MIYHVALPFVATEDGLSAGDAVECRDAMAAIQTARAMARNERHVGAVAFSRSGSPDSGEYEDARILEIIGEVPDELHPPRLGGPAAPTG